MIKYGDARLPARFWTKVQATDACWLWTAAKNHGYGYIRFDGRAQNGHRIAYQLLVGPIENGYDVDHLCHGADSSCPGGVTCPHRACVNPAHLEAVPPKTNKLRGRSPHALHAAQTVCSAGHPLSGDNLWIDRGARICRQCKLATNGAYRDTHREQIRDADREYRDRVGQDVIRQRNREAQARRRARRGAT